LGEELGKYQFGTSGSPYIAIILAQSQREWAKEDRLVGHHVCKEIFPRTPFNKTEDVPVDIIIFIQCSHLSSKP
jgi:hypothetical protein